MYSSAMLKGRVSRDFRPLFFALKTLPGHHMNRLKLFSELFGFREEIQFLSSKIACLLSQRLRKHRILALDYPLFIF